MKAPAINQDACKGCGLCIAECPQEALGWSGARNRAGYTLPHVAGPDRCTACRMCELICPDFAIYLEGDPE
jgi:2-oxoglutarate ferredoxin oxidoreductase subunit delta